MTPSPFEDDLHRSLRHTADGVDRAPLSVGDVRTRARGIRRRRVAAAGAAVAAVLAVAVPIGLSTVGDQRSAVAPAADPAPDAPRVGGTVRLDPRSAPVVDATGVGLLDIDAPRLLVDGATTDLPEAYDQLVPYGEGWMGVVNVEGAYSVRELGADLRVLDEAPVASRLVVSDDGTRIAWAEHDRDAWRIVDRDATRARDDRSTSVPGSVRAAVRVVGFLPGDELVAAQRRPRDGSETTVVVAPDGRTRPLDGFERPTAASGVAGLVAGQVSSDLEGSCSQVIDGTTGEPVWDTCEHSLRAFSPDGRHLAAFDSYLDGNGSPTMSVLDADTGETVVDLELAGSRTGVVGIQPESVWEDDDHLVVMAFTGGRQYAVRVGLDGTVERIGGIESTVEPGFPSWRLAAV